MFAGQFTKAKDSLLRLATVPGDDRLTRVVRQLSRGAWTTLYHGDHPLADGRRLRAMSNLWAWQAWRRIVRRPLLVELQTGTKLLCPTWSTIAGAWVSIGVHEPELFFVADVSRPGDLFIDVGANIGVYAVTAAIRGARALAFEPTSDARAAVVENAAVNGVSELVTASPFALADYEGTARFTVGNDCINQFANDDVASVPIQVSTLTACVRELAGPDARPDLIKIDVEGAEAAVLRGALEVLEKHRPSVIIEVWGGGAPLRSFVEALGHRAYHYDYRKRSLVALPADHAEPGNIIMIHPDRFDGIVERLRAAPPWPQPGPVPHWDFRRATAR